MKKLSLLLVSLLMITGVTFAQSNKSVVIETGENQTATINQDGFLNDSYVNQEARKNTATVEQVNHIAHFNTLSNVIQTGEKNEATVKQNTTNSDLGASYEGTLKALVVQQGNGNEALQVQGPAVTGNLHLGKADAEIIQGGNKNYASQHQLSYGNVARINQGGSNNGAMQAQDTEILPDDEATMNTATINQTGSDNEAIQLQLGHGNLANVSQSGWNNNSVQTQAMNSWVSIAEVNQTGSDNTADQYQIGKLNKANIDQASNRNTAIQKQFALITRRAGAIDYTPYNEASISQKGGERNWAEQTQTATVVDVPKNYASIIQDGGLNQAYQTQTGSDNSSIIMQTGNSNLVNITQTMP